MAGEVRAQEVLAPPAEAAVFLVLTLRPGAERTVHTALPDVAALTRSVGFRAPDDTLSCVVGIGAAAWPRIYRLPRPAGLHPFRAITGARHTAVSTPGDLFLHVRSRRIDLCFELARRLLATLAGAVDVVDEVHGFRYLGQRDALGFAVGTDNPEGAAAVAAVTVGAEDPSYAGGSYVVVQKYLHDLEAWRALSVEEQERAMGRTKLGNIELRDRAANSHVALSRVVDANGRRRRIVRDQMAFGSVGAGEFGTYVASYAGTTDAIERILYNRYVGNPPGQYDRILDFSTAVTGTLFFVPTADFLENPLVPAPGATSRSLPAGADGSLGIGSLRRSRT